MKAVKRRDIPALEWLDDVTAPRATMIGTRRALIENHLGIIEFTPERVRLSSKLGEITVEGENLSISQARARSLIVSGRICRVTMPGEMEISP